MADLTESLKDNLRFTLYEIFGYVIPGLPTEAALVFIYWFLFHADHPLQIATGTLLSVDFAAVLLFAYLLGHSVQAVANLVLRFKDDELLCKGSADSKRILLETAHRLAGAQLGVETGKLAFKEFFRYMDEYAVQSGATAERDMFTYREGFYRGNAVAVGLLAIVVAVRIPFGGVVIQVSSNLFNASRGELGFLAAVLAAVSFMCFRRFRRFSEYRVNKVLNAFIVSATLNNASSKEEK